MIKYSGYKPTAKIIDDQERIDTILSYINLNGISPFDTSSSLHVFEDSYDIQGKVYLISYAISSGELIHVREKIE